MMLHHFITMTNNYFTPLPLWWSTTTPIPQKRYTILKPLRRSTTSPIYHFNVIPLDHFNTNVYYRTTTTIQLHPFLYLGSDLADESASLPGDSITQPTTTNDDDDDDDNDVVVGGDFDTSFDTSEILPNDDSRSPLPLSEAHHRLDDSVRFMLQSASDLVPVL